METTTLSSLVGFFFSVFSVVDVAFCFPHPWIFRVVFTLNEIGSNHISDQSSHRTEVNCIVFLLLEHSFITSSFRDSFRLMKVFLLCCYLFVVFGLSRKQYVFSDIRCYYLIVECSNFILWVVAWNCYSVDTVQYMNNYHC